MRVTIASPAARQGSSATCAWARSSARQVDARFLPPAEAEVPRAAAQRPAAARRWAAAWRPAEVARPAEARPAEARAAEARPRAAARRQVEVAVSRARVFPAIAAGRPTAVVARATVARAPVAWC